jgi:hypothetical protein
VAIEEAGIDLIVASGGSRVVATAARFFAQPKIPSSGAFH